MYFDNQKDPRYYEGGAHFKYKDLVIVLNHLIKTLPQYQHERSESSKVHRNNVININLVNEASTINPNNKEQVKQSRNIKPLMQSLTQKITDFTKDKNDMIVIKNKVNTVEARGRKESQSKEKAKMFIVEDNNDILTRNMILKKLYNKRNSFKTKSENQTRNKDSSSKSKKHYTSVIKSNSKNRKIINLSQNKYTRNKPKINEMFKVGNTNKDNFTFIGNQTMMMGNTRNKKNIDLTGESNKTKITDIKKRTLLQIPHNHIDLSSTFSKHSKANQSNSFISYSLLKPSNLKHQHTHNKINTFTHDKVPQPKQNKSYYCPTDNNNEISLLSDPNTSSSKDKEKISINQINTTNNNNNIILHPKINISFVNNIMQKSPSHSRPISKLKTNEKKSRNKPIEYNNSIMKLNTTVKQKFINEIFQTNQPKKSKEISLEKKVPKERKTFNLAEHYSSLQKTINIMKMKTKTNLAKISHDFENILTNKRKGNSINKVSFQRKIKK